MSAYVFGRNEKSWNFCSWKCAMINSGGQGWAMQYKEYPTDPNNSPCVECGETV